MHRLIKALRTGMSPDMDVYDAATWSCITELSIVREISVRCVVVAAVARRRESTLWRA